MASTLGTAGTVPAAPRETLDPRMRTVWRLTAMLWGAALLVVALIAAMIAIRLDAPPVFPVMVVALLALCLIAVVAVGPDIDYRHWRYELRDEELDLQHGIFTITRTVIPMARVQHVDTRRGPLDRWFGLAGLVIYTAAGSSTIPGLSEATAGHLRSRIAALANTRDDL